MGEQHGDLDDTASTTRSDDAATVPNESGAAGNEAPAPRGAHESRYTNEGRLGAGAMGAVHLCHDHLIGRRVAQKAMHREQRTDPWRRRRFEHEARIQGQLEHPAIVPVYDVAVGPDGLEYFTMRRVEGSSLRQILAALREKAPDAERRYGLRRLLSAFATVCLAIAFAHKRGIVHRDIKPSNVMLGDYGEVYVLDWGIARVLGEDESSEERRAASVVVPAVAGAPQATEVGVLIGTIGYMAPEQARGEPAGPAADVYALGAVLFEIVTLQRMHSTDGVEAMRELEAGVEARPSRRAPERRVAQELEDLCVRATAKDPKDRPDAQGMHDAIQVFLDGQRDHDRREQLAAEQVVLAREELAQAISGGAGASEARERAFEAIHRALALDVENERAAEVLHALVRAPVDVTGQVDAALVSTGLTTRREAGRAGGLLFGLWFVGTGGAVALGVRSWSLLALEMALVFVAGVLVSVNARKQSPVILWTVLVLANVAAVGVSAAFGWLVLVPGLLMFIAVGYAIVSRPLSWYRAHEPGMRFLRAGTILLGPLALVLEVVLEVAGVLPPSVVFRDGNIVILPRVTDFPETGTTIFLAIVNILLIVGPSIIVLRLRDSMFASEQRTFDMAARLRELLPAEARRAAPSLTAVDRGAKENE
jgi:serine/threonine-protein kinase